MTRLLLCEDDDQLARGLSRALRRAGHDVIRVISVADALHRVRTEGPADISLIDLGLPDGHGSTVVAAIRERSDAGIIILTAYGDERARVIGLRAGADDYVVKPFGVAELLARIDAVSRRTMRLHHEPRQEIVVGPVGLDLEARTVTSGEHAVKLTKKEAAVLVRLLTHPGTVVSRRHILSEVWPEAPQRASRSLDTHIAALRAKLPAAVHVETVHGSGYRLTVTDPEGTG